MRKIAFVDDEQKVLDGIRRTLRAQRHEWDMKFFSSGREALEHFAREDYDVVVSDMRMPEMDGAALLTEVKKTYPSMVRIILSGQTEMEAAVRAVHVAHQFLNKPCEAETLKRVIGRACALQEFLCNDKLEDVVGSIESLPALPHTYQELTVALVDPNVGPREVAAIVGKDQGMSAKMLQLVNSSFFSLARRISEIQHAVSILGLNMIKNLVLSAAVFRANEDGLKSFEPILRQVQEHSIQVASYAHGLLSEKNEQEDAMVAGMLHEVGLLVMATHLPREFKEVLALSTKGDLSLYEAQMSVVGVGHPEMGAYLLGLWGLPWTVVEAVAHHHQPERIATDHFGVLGALHVANAVCATHNPGLGITGCDTLDEKYLGTCCAPEKVEAWRTEVGQVMQRGS